MSQPIPINLAVEDALSEVVVREILSQSGQPFPVGACYGKGGFGHGNNNRQTRRSGGLEGNGVTLSDERG